MARAEGIRVEVLLVEDDVALKSTKQLTGARGLAGTIFIHKLVGAATAEGKTLAEVAAIGKAAVQSLATMGVSFSAGTSPAVGKPSFELAEDEMELGLGIHGEPGAQRAPIQPADELTETLLTQILQNENLGPEDRVAVMINNLGATTPMELAIIARHAVPFLQSKGLAVERIYAGGFLTSLDMAGISISLLEVDDDRLRWLDASTAAPAWPNLPVRRPGLSDVPATLNPLTNKPTVVISPQATISASGLKMSRAIEAACQALIAATDELTEMDRITGDGDLGASMERASKAVLTNIASYPLNDVPATLRALAHTVRQALGGSSGPLYGVLLLRTSTVLESSAAIGSSQWAEALAQGNLAISELGEARPGDRTMLDALDPFVTDAQRFGRRETFARSDVGRGRSSRARSRRNRQYEAAPRAFSYLGDRVLGHPDPGAKAVAILMRAIYPPPLRLATTIKIDSEECLQILPQAHRLVAAKQRLQLPMRTLPDWRSRGKQSHPLWRRINSLLRRSSGSGRNLHQTARSAA